MVHKKRPAVYSTSDGIFVIPTYRLRDVGDTVEAYDANFRQNGHAMKIMVFDDSSLANHEKYYPKLEQTRTYNPVFYVGPTEKQKFTEILLGRLNNRRLEPLVNSLFRPSYGGNRNFTLLYTLGHMMISSDDDMRPEGLIETSSRVSLGNGEIARGGLVKVSDQERYSVEHFDIVASFLEVLGKYVKHVPRNYLVGELLVDSSMDLETNKSMGLSQENSLSLKLGKVNPKAVVKAAQTFRTGTNDIDALDFADLFLMNQNQIDPDTLNDLYVIRNFRPVVTAYNWRMDCGVAGYDNSHGLPPFFPTRLRFEDYIYRLWLTQPKFASAHVNSVQRHMKNSYMRQPLSSEILNEEIANFLKRKIKGSITKLDDLSISFDYDGSITGPESEEILEKIRLLHGRVEAAMQESHDEQRTRALSDFGDNLKKTFFSFEPDAFQQHISRQIDDEISLIRSSLELWHTLVEICYFYKDKQDLPQRRVNNKQALA